MLWGVASPPGDYMYVSGMRNGVPATTDPPYVVVMKVEKATGNAVMPIYEYKTQTVGDGRINGGDIVYGTDGFLYVVGWEPHATLKANGFVLKLNPATMLEAGFGFKKFTYSQEALFYRAAFYDNKIWAAGFTTAVPSAPAGNMDWLVVSFDATTGDPINQKVGFTNAEGYPCDDEANDIYVNAAGVFVIGQVDTPTQPTICVQPGTSTPRISLSMTIKLNHNLTTNNYHADPIGDGWSVAGIGGKIFTLSRGYIAPNVGWRYEVLTEDLTTVLQEVISTTTPGASMPRSIDVRNLLNENGAIIGVKIVTGGFKSDYCTGSCVPTDSYDWRLEGWQYINATQALTNLWKQTDFADNGGRSDIAHHVIFNPNFENSFFVVGCTHAASTDGANDCFISDKTSSDYDLAAQARDFLTGL